MASQSISQEFDLENVGMHVEASYEKTLRLRVKELLNCSTENFPGAVPVMLDKEKLSYLKEEDYFVCEKSDGVRYMMLSVYTALGPATFLIDRNNTYRYIESFLLPCKDNPGKYHHETLLDGELVINRDRETKQKTIKYLVFDLMVHNSNVITKRPLNSRLGLLRQEIIEPFEQSLLNPEVSKKAPFMINLKRVERSYGMNLILTSLPLLDHSSDGLIFTPVFFPYKPGSCSKLLKWKPAEHNTADFRILVTHNSDRKPVYQLQVASGTANKIFSPLQLPPDIYTKWRTAPPDGKIAEFRWDPSWAVTTTEKGYAPQTVKGGWVFVRLRPDKKVPNDESAARSAIRAIEDGVSREMLEESTDTIRARWKERERNQDGQPPLMTSKTEASKPSTDCIESKDGVEFDDESKDDIADALAKPVKDNPAASVKEHSNGDSFVSESKISEVSSPRESKSISEKTYPKSKHDSPALPVKPTTVESHVPEISNKVSNGATKISLEKVVDSVQSEKAVENNQASVTEKANLNSSETKKGSRVKEVIKPPPGEPMEVDLPQTEASNREDGKRAGSVSILEYHTPRKMSRRQFSDSNIDIELTTNFSQETSFIPQDKPTSHENTAPIISQENAKPDPPKKDATNVQSKVNLKKPSVSPALRLDQVMNQKEEEQNPHHLAKEDSNNPILKANSVTSLKAMVVTPTQEPKYPSISPSTIQATNDARKCSPVLPINNGHQVSKIIEAKEITESPTAIKPIPQPPKRSSNLFALMSPTNSEPSYPVNDSVPDVNTKVIQEAYSDTPVLVASSTKDFPKTIPEFHSETEPPLSSIPPRFIRPNNPVQQSPSGSGSMELSDIASPLVDNDTVVVDRKNRNKKTSGIAHLLNGNSNNSSHPAPYDPPIVTPKESPNHIAPAFSPNLPAPTAIPKEAEPSKSSNIVSRELPLVPRQAPNSFRPEREIVAAPKRVSEPESAKVINPIPDNGVIPTGLPRTSTRMSERPNYSEKTPTRPSLRPSRTAVRPDAVAPPPRTLPYSTQPSTIPGPQGGNYLYGSMSSLGARPQMMSQAIAPSQPNVTHQQMASREATMRRGSNSAHYYRPSYPETGSVVSSGATIPPGMRRSSLSQSGWVNGRPEPYPTQSLHSKYNQSTYPGISSRPINLPPGSMPSTVPSNGSGISMFSRPGPQPSHHPQGLPPGHPQGYPQQGHPQGYPPNHHPGHHPGPPPGSMSSLPPGFHPNPPPQTSLPNHPQVTLQGHQHQPMRPKPYPTHPPGQGPPSQPYPTNLPHSQPYPMGYNQYNYQHQPNSHHPSSGQMYPTRPFQSPQPHSLPPNQTIVPSQKPPSQPLPSSSAVANSIPPTSAAAPPPQSRQSKGMLDFIMNP